MKRAAIRTIKTIGCLVVLLLMVHSVLLVVSGLSLRRAQNRLQEAGRPMTPEEIVLPMVTPARNAAPFYEAAFALLRADSSVGEYGEEALFNRLGLAAASFWREPDSGENRRNLEALLSHEFVPHALHWVDAAVARPACNFHLPYSQGLEMLNPHIHNLILLQRILMANALMEAEEGHAANAWNYVEQSVRLGDALRDELTLLNLLVRVALYTYSFEATRRVSDFAPPDEQVTKRLAHLIERAKDMDPYLRALDGERLFIGEWSFHFMSMQWFQEKFRFRGGSSDPGFGERMKLRLQRVVHAYRPLRQLDHALFLDRWLDLTSTFEEPDWEWLSQFGNRALPGRSDLPWYSVMSRLLLPEQDGLLSQMARFRADARVVRVGLAAKSYKELHGAYPDDLGQLVPEFLDPMPLDPFTGQELIYRRENGGFVLYSLGENRTDNGGTPQTDENRESGEFDIVWRASATSGQRP